MQIETKSTLICIQLANIGGKSRSVSIKSENSIEMELLTDCTEGDFLKTGANQKYS